MGRHPHRRRFYLICYDIADNERRDDVSELLSGYGPRVQYSVFEAAVETPHVFDQLQQRLTDLVDPDEDQVRIYPLRVTDLDKITIIGNRRLEERDDFWII
ncbi:CRISPR-associated endonuclease Cas2 [Thermobifida halotolerans]|uniref:CRISPR-associated endoribonuclease Cas2 n=1 Tax=Thermobifida halotolerans TaxID=483545 RepID=A0A399G3G8_9ACTN|nr:CRISPR-associated endonuclease Cas2 [Thermobifida halotolerans]UOE19095.1 CRISPR-associated endonuclease Cas2 [Thermobifida halotolerans]